MRDGTSLETLLLRQALGGPVPEIAREREEPAVGVAMLHAERTGVLKGVSGIDAARAVAGIVDVSIPQRTGKPVAPLPQGDPYLGFIFARGTEYQHVLTALRTARRHITWHVET